MGQSGPEGARERSLTRRERTQKGAVGGEAIVTRKKKKIKVKNKKKKRLREERQWEESESEREKRERCAGMSRDISPASNFLGRCRLQSRIDSQIFDWLSFESTAVTDPLLHTAGLGRFCNKLSLFLYLLFLVHHPGTLVFFFIPFLSPASWLAKGTASNVSNLQEDIMGKLT